RELDRARVCVRPVRVEGQLPHLLVRGLADLVAVRVADLHGKEAREGVEVALAVDVLEVAALAAHDDRRLVTVHTREVKPEMLARGLLQLARTHACQLRTHTRVPQS